MLSIFYNAYRNNFNVLIYEIIIATVRPFQISDFPILEVQNREIRKRKDYRV